MTPDDPKYIDHAYAEAAHFFQAGDLALARARLAPALALNPADARIHALAGFIGLRSGDAAGAVEALRRAVDLDPRQSVFALALGDALLATVNPVEAEPIYRRAIAADRSNLPAIALR